MPSLPAETPRTTHPITRLLPREGECLHTGYRHARVGRAAGVLAAHRCAPAAGRERERTSPTTRRLVRCCLSV